MGYGDELIGSGLARGAAGRGKRIAFGDGRRIIWSDQSHAIFRGNPNVARPGSERSAHLEWIAHYRGNRLYGSVQGGRWQFRDMECQPGEIFFEQGELAFAARLPLDPFIVIEPRVKPLGACAGANKQWPLSRYEKLAEQLKRETGLRVVQFVPIGWRPLVTAAEVVQTPSFRHAVAVLQRAALYIGPEGGLHHGAAAVGTKAVVIFGGFNTPRSTGYPWHENLTVGDPCGTTGRCFHCQDAMAAIGIGRVHEAALRQLAGGFT